MNDRIFVEKIIPIRDSDDKLVVRLFFPEKCNDEMFDPDWDVYSCEYTVTYANKKTGIKMKGSGSYQSMLHAIFAIGSVVRAFIKDYNLRLDLEGSAFDFLFPLPESMREIWSDREHLFKPPFQE